MDLVKIEAVDVFDAEVTLKFKLRELLAIYTIVGDADLEYVADEITDRAEHLQYELDYNFKRVAEEIRQGLGHNVYHELESILDDFVHETR